MIQKHILLVEDEPDQRRGFAALLRGLGYAVAETGDAASAVERLQVESFDLLISDHRLGGATGMWLERVAMRSLSQPPPDVLIVMGHEAGERFLLEVEQALTCPLSDAARVASPARIALVLYLSDSMASHRTRRTVQMVLDEYVRMQVVLTIIDLSVGIAYDADQYRLVVTPTLLQTFPAPRVWIAGECSEPDLLHRILDQAGVEHVPVPLLHQIPSTRREAGYLRRVTMLMCRSGRLSGTSSS